MVPQAVQIFWCRPFPLISICSQAILHKFRDKMFPDEHGTESDYPYGFQLRRYQYPDFAVV
ncbi:hypothetical protein ACHAQE_003024 [Botrytis cinerea]